MIRKTILVRKGFVALALLLAAAATGSACAMTTSSTGRLRCVVQGAEKLPSEIGGQGAVCSAMERAAAPMLQRAGIAPGAVLISVNVRSQDTISATASVDNRNLPELYVGISDGALSTQSIDMLAEGVAVELSKLGQK